jgi:hypothetical protein
MFSFIADWCFERHDDGPEDMNEDAPEDLTPSSREADRKRLQAEVDEYLKSGGVIDRSRRVSRKAPRSWQPRRISRMRQRQENEHTGRER